MVTFTGISKWYMVLILGLCAQAAIAETDVFLNAVDELAAVSDKKISIYTDSRDTSNGCTFNYGTSSPSITRTVQDYNQQGWRLANWRQLAGFCNSNYTTVTSSNVRSTVGQNFSQNLYLGSNRITMGIRSVEHFRLKYGSVYFRNASEINKLSPADQMNYKWPELFLSKSFAPRALKDYSQINFAFTATLRTFGNNTNRVAGNSPPWYSQVNYDANQHATQFRIAFSVQWRDRVVCPKGKQSDATLFCRNNFGKYVHFMMRILDDRFEFQPASSAWMIDGGGDKVGTGMAMYRMDMTKLTTPYSCNVVNKYGAKETLCNPFKQVKTTNSISTNLKPIINAALLEGIKNQAVSGVLPQRIAGESDKAYLSHFYISSANIGYEVSGLSSISFDIHQFSISGVK